MYNKNGGVPVAASGNERCVNIPTDAEEKVHVVNRLNRLHACYKRSRFTTLHYVHVCTLTCTLMLMSFVGTKRLAH